MALARVTPATALTQMRQLASELPRLLADTGSLSVAPQLLRQMEMLPAASGNASAFLVDVWIDDGTAAADAARWLLGDATADYADASDGPVSISGRLGAKPVTLALTSSSRPAPIVPGQLAANVLVWLRGDASGAPIDIEERALIVTTSGRPTGIQTVRDPVVVERAAADGVLPRLFAPASAAQTMELLHADAVARAIEALLAIAAIAFDQELRGIRAKRALAQQRAAELQGRQTPAAANELTVSIRTRLQRTFSDFARGVDDRFASAVTSPQSPVWVALEQRLAAIDRLERDVRVKTVATRLPSDVEQEWLDGLRSALHQHCVADLGALRDMLRAAAHDVETAIAEGGGPPVVVQFQRIGSDRLDRILDGHVLPQRKYQGELPKQGPFEYLMMARRYQTLVFMLLSAFGLSFLRSYRDLMIPVAIALLSLGVLQMIHTVRRERVELAEKELDKVRELLRAESRRILGDVQRAWPSLLTQHLADQLPLMLGQAESALRDHASRSASESADERQRLQRQLQACEVAERKLAMPQKTREAMAQAIAQARGELRQLIAAAQLNPGI